MRRIPNEEGGIPAGVRRRLEPLARLHAVTVERLVEVVRARRKFRRGRDDRQRSRKRVLKNNGNARSFKMLQHEARYVGEGEFGALLRMAGISEVDFAHLAGIDASAVRRWCRNPLFSWPAELLRYFL